LLICYDVSDVTVRDDRLQKGCEVLGLSDMAMPDQLYLYMVGGQKRPMVNMSFHSVPHSVMMNGIKVNYS